MPAFSFKGQFCVENVDPFYEPLVRPTKQIGRHLFWTNFRLGNFEPKDNLITEGKRDDWRDLYGFDLSNFKLDSRKDQIYRNCVEPETGLYIFDCAKGIIKSKSTQSSISF